MEESAKVRWVIQEYLWPKIETLGYSLPPQCPINIKADQHSRIVEAKAQMTRQSWRCTVCGKMFKGEHYLDKHLTNRHPELYTEVSDRPCLADHCHVLHCDHAHGDPDDGRVFSWLPSATCNRLDMEMRYAACMGVADQCFPPSATDRHTAHLRSYFLVQFCKPHTCERAHQRPFSLGPLIGDSKWGWLVASVVVLTMLAFFYAITGFWLWERASANKGDLRRLKRPEGSQGWLSWVPFTSKSKSKAY